MAGDFVVLGLGIFGRSVALGLAALGQSVMAIDRDERLVQDISEEIDSAICADATDEDALAELRLERMTCAVVAIGMDSMQSSILATALLAQMGIPRIIARSVGDLHSRVLRAVGAHEVINPEVEIGRRLARSLSQPNVVDRIELGDKAELAEVEVPASFVGHGLVGLDIRRKHDVTVVAVRRKGRIVARLDQPGQFREGDVMAVIGSPEAIHALATLA